MVARASSDVRFERLTVTSVVSMVIVLWRSPIATVAELVVYPSGMRADAIQNERDVIGKRRRVDEEGDRGAEFLKRLLDSEKLCIQLRDSVIKTTGQVMYDKGKIKYEGNERIATLDDVGASIHQRLVLTVEWAKSLHEFSSLPLDDQASLLKANATPLIVLGVALRSLHAEGGIWLANDKMLTADSSYLVGDINAVVSRIIKVSKATELRFIFELVIPLRDLEIDPTESVALKAVLFFNPYNIGRPCTSNETVESLKKTRLSALNALRSSLKNNTVQSSQLPFNTDDECRFGQLLLLLPNVLAVAQQLIEDVQLCRLFNLTEIDELMQALILHEPERSGSEIIVEQLIATSEATSAFHGDI
ncbi:Zinc finger and Nuclear hormone receptor domain containing protein [Aphelenchoides besseyi]|nr:Zinc finger and Nuclear hormone receptor domain containing protein [Aphelenchoides besseyi]